MNKPETCPDCEQRKLLSHYDLRITGKDDAWLCRDCYQIRVAPFVRRSYKSQWD